MFSFEHSYDSELNLNETASGTQYTDNVIPISQAALNKEQRQYDNAGRVVKTGRFTYHYDECGRAIQKIEQKDGFRPQTTTFSWDENDRLIRIELPNGERWRYRYDAFGRRVAKECERGAKATQQVHYLYDGAQLIQQALKTANGVDVETTEYIYEPGSFRPVAQVNTNHELQTEKLHYIVNDHSGTPRELCTETGDIVWRGEQGLWQRHQQRLQTNVKRLFEDAANDPVNCDLRYQGQIEDKESGLYYNLNRYYDADSGQYLSSDPIGIAGGLRPQAYVHNPMEWVDPLGLAGCSAKPSVSGLAPSDFNTFSLASRQDTLELWNQALKSKAFSTHPKGNKYQDLLKELESGVDIRDIDKELLEDAFGAVSSKYTSLLRAKHKQGLMLDVGDGPVHHWNYNKVLYPQDLVDPRNLVMTKDRTHHMEIHRATTSGHITKSPIGSEHVREIENYSNPIVAVSD